MRQPQEARVGGRVVDWRVNPATAREVAAAYLNAPALRDPLTSAAYAQLVAESDELFKSITASDRPQRVRVFFSRCPEPYRDAQELIASVSGDRVLEVTTVATEADRRHPLMDSTPGGAYDRLRAVHDILGHARLRLGFDRNGEFAAWLSQERLHSPLARRALATELHGQHSVRWTTGEVAAPKAILFDPGMLHRAHQPVTAMTSGSGTSRRPATAPQPATGSGGRSTAVSTASRSRPARWPTGSSPG